MDVNLGGNYDPALTGQPAVCGVLSRSVHIETWNARDFYGFFYGRENDGEVAYTTEWDSWFLSLGKTDFGSLRRRTDKPNEV